MSIKTYSELITFSSFLDRYKYLKIGGTVGTETFGRDRYLNQILYHSGEWKAFRNDIIIRDMGCDLGCVGFELNSRIVVHHIDPITVEDVINRNRKVFDPDNVICTSHTTHQAIHYGNEALLIVLPLERSKNDTCPWRR